MTEENDGPDNGGSINSKPLAGRVAVVTGVAGSIGRSICVRLAAGGAHVIGVDSQPVDDFEYGRIAAHHEVEWSSFVLDVTDKREIYALREQVQATFGRCDVLVNNAAMNDAISFDELDVDCWSQILEVNLTAPFLLSRALIPLMREHQSGRIINIGSGSVLNPMRQSIAYRASKMGLIGLTRALSTEVGEDGITVNVVAPGVVVSSMSANSLSLEFMEATKNRQAVKRLGQPDDISSAVFFLASPEAQFITGQTLYVNGGSAFG
ncbi:SDR family oxidoreductase (plasmid) [Rhodococcus sp. USK10]|uniref:SDR family NAD(P)-dependent oxidoreductase n=1 Tax=Rhodococcus sp. USK10 TaxID=2789739 RepID=UPI001C5DF4FE|nr:SDR family oxidoreductase [Rhodococcus sp. USK10]QYB00241.1 SDR family oxidoreductase [Rhodococcus sp. USK10]